MKRTNLNWSALIWELGLFLFPFQLFALDPAKTVYQYNCQNWSYRAGLIEESVNAITQTRDGYLWLGTQRGLIRFDGTEFRPFTPPDQLRLTSRCVSALTGIRDGALWFGIRNGAVGIFNAKTGFATLTNTAWVDPAMNVISIAQVSDGSVWVGSDSGAGRWSKQETGQTNFYADLTGLTAIHEDAQHRIWLGTAERGLFYWVGGKLNAFPDTSLAPDCVSAIAVDRAGRIWVGTRVGLRCYDTNFHAMQQPPIYSDVKALLVDRHEVLWVGTTAEGLFRCKEGVFSTFRKTDGLANDDVTSLFEDHEGSLWIGTRKGLTQLTDIKLPIYSSTEGLLSGGYHDVSRASDGAVWVATSRGISHFDGVNVINYSTNAGISVPYIKRVFESRNGDVILINGNKEIEILSQGKVVAKHTSRSWPTAMAEDSHGPVVSIGGSLFRIRHDGLVPYELPKTNTPQFFWVRNLFGCRDGSLLVSSVNGLFRFKDGSVERWSVEQGLSDANIISACEDGEGTVWIGMAAGLARLKNGQILNISRAHGLHDNFIYAIVPDEHGAIWALSERGIFEVKCQSIEDLARGFTNRVECIAFDSPDSAKALDTTEVEYTGCRTLDGRIWFPSHQGIVMIDPKSITENPVIPPVHVQVVRANGVEISDPNHPPLQAGKGDLEIQFTALSYIAPGGIRFRYQLEGYDSGWIEAGDRRTAFYTNLKPGHYHFKVQACNSSGVWNTAGDGFEIELPPHFYQMTWFAIVCGVFGLGCVAAIYFWSFSRYQRRQLQLQAANEQLEAKVIERTSELATSLSLTRATLESTADGILVTDGDGKVTSLNEQFLCMWRLPRGSGNSTPEEEMLAQASGQLKNPASFLAAVREIYARPDDDSFDILEFADGRTFERSSKPQRIGDKTVGRVWSFRDITSRRQAEAELETMHRQLMTSSRFAGMAEVATSVLHNVGNVLTSVNVSASIVEDKLRKSGVESLGKTAALLRQNERNLPHFLGTDDKGRQLVGYIEALAKRLSSDKVAILEELKQLTRNIDHIKEIVSMQQTYARVAGVLELVRPEELMDDALRMHSLAYERHGVKLQRDYSATPPINVDRHKVVQILVNLLQNAKYACDQNTLSQRVITVRVASAGPESVRLEVIDNGMGIPAENLTRIFSHGFTTRKGGHGFGLHSGALAAKEMNGTLTAHSDGPGKGATFVLELPVQQPIKPVAVTRNRPISVESSTESNVDS